MYSQANVREESVLRPPTRALPPVIVSAEKVLAGSGMGPVGEDSAAPRQGANDPDAGWKGGRP